MKKFLCIYPKYNPTYIPDDPQFEVNRKLWLYIQWLFQVWNKFTTEAVQEWNNLNVLAAKNGQGVRMTIMWAWASQLICPGNNCWGLTLLWLLKIAVWFVWPPGAWDVVNSRFPLINSYHSIDMFTVPSDTWCFINTVTSLL